MVHPTPTPVNPHTSDVGFLTPRIRRLNASCAADSAAVDCRTPRIPRSIGHLAVDSASLHSASLLAVVGTLFRLELTLFLFQHDPIFARGEDGAEGTISFEHEIFPCIE